MTVVLPVSGRQARRVIGQHRGTQRRTAPSDPYRDNLVARMRELAVANPRRGRRYVMDFLHKERWSIGARLMKRLWRREGLLVPQKRVNRRRTGTGENGIKSRGASMKNEVLGMDFVQGRTADAAPSACWWCWTSTRGNAWRSRWRGTSAARTLCRCWTS
jgi:putative transposase